MNKSYALSISRWHKVAERLARTYTELTHGVSNTFSNTQINGYFGSAQITRLKESAKSEYTQLHRAFDLQDALIQIRQAIGEANAKNGVANVLAEYDALTRRQKLLESILTAQSSDMVSFDDMPELPKQFVSEDRYDRSRASLRVRMLDSTTESLLRKESEDLRAKVYVLADRISDLNCDRVTLELPEDVAQAAGL